MLLAKDPFTVDAGWEFTAKVKQVLPSLDKDPLQLELIDMQVASNVKQMFKAMGCEPFWIHLNQVQFLKHQKASFFFFFYHYMRVKLLTHEYNKNTLASHTSRHRQCLWLAVTYS